MIANKPSDILQFPQGHCFQFDVLAKSGVAVRTPEEMEEIVVEHAELMGRPQAKSITRAKPVSAALAAKQRLGRRAWEATGRRAVYADN